MLIIRQRYFEENQFRLNSQWIISYAKNCSKFFFVFCSYSQVQTIEILADIFFYISA